MKRLAPGLTHTLEVTVTAAHSPRHLAPTVVLSTPNMIGFMERAATTAVQMVLGERTTVGTHVDVSHESAARENERVVFTATLATVDGRRLWFEVDAKVDDRIIGRGRHQRTIIDRTRFRST